MNRWHSRYPLARALALIVSSLSVFTTAVWLAGASSENTNICRPVLEPVPLIHLGEAGQFRWSCTGGVYQGDGYYIVFVRPIGTYVLLKVPQGRNSFEFAPDMEGQWRCIVINTDPNRSLPDLESEPIYFEVVKPPESHQSGGKSQ
jgi:hypothetical protein|uniref:Secreted protein n=1 Tax=Desulfomonile tiedjei TaxID=2358 RepID=A0A7C4EWI2_9BACT